MAFTVEDGTGVAGANSYVTVQGFVSYWLDRNKDYGDNDPEVLQAALVAATDYIEVRFGDRWKGTQVSKDQALGWPRLGVITRNGVLEGTIIPEKVKKAIYEYAVRALTKVLLPDPTVDPNVRRTETHLGPIREIVQYSGGSAVELFRPYPAADLLLSDLIIGAAGSYR